LDSLLRDEQVFSDFLLAFESADLDHRIGFDLGFFRGGWLLGFVAFGRRECAMGGGGTGFAGLGVLESIVYGSARAGALSGVANPGKEAKSNEKRSPDPHFVYR